MPDEEYKGTEEVQELSAEEAAEIALEDEVADVDPDKMGIEDGIEGANE